MQLGEFWEDLVNLPDGIDHYTGMISLQRLESDAVQKWQNVAWKINQGYAGYYVVDGQQRLTTCVILVQAIVEFMERHTPEGEAIYINSEPLEEIRSRFLYDVDKSSAAKLVTYIFGYEKDNPSYEFFKKRILNAENDALVQETFYTLNLENAKQFFQGQLEELYSEDGASHEKGMAEIQKIYKKLTQNLKFNLYTIQNDFDVFVTFETMNNRGKRLTTLELLKNRLIYLSTLFRTDEASKRQLRREINETWQTIYGYLGKDKNNPMSDDDFLREHTILYFGYGQKQRKFDEFLLKEYFTQKRLLAKTVEVAEEDLSRGDLDDEEGAEDAEDENNVDINTGEQDKKSGDKLELEDVLDYVRSLRETSTYWYELYFPEQSDLSDGLKLWLGRLLRCQSANFRPLIFALLTRRDIGDEQKVECLRLIEEFIFFYFSLDGYATTYQRTVYFNFAHDLFTGKVALEDIMERLGKISCLEERDGKRLLKYNEVTNRITKLFNYDGYYSWRSIRYFLYEYESWLKGTNIDTGREFGYDVFAPKVKNDHKMSIEHVFPQTPDKDDKAEDAWVKVFADYTPEQQKFLNGSLGNLVLLSLPENIALQNHKFKDKCAQRYQRGTVSEMQVCLTEDGKQREIWDAYCILERGLKMLKFMEERWGFEFYDEYDKVKLLRLDFLKEEPEGYADPGARYSETADSKERATNNKITRELIEEAYRLAKEVYADRMNANEAADALEKLGMNRSSAIMYISCFGPMMKGEIYKRQISAEATEYYIDKITEEYGEESGELARQAARLNREYLKTFTKSTR